MNAQDSKLNRTDEARLRFQVLIIPLMLEIGMSNCVDTIKTAGYANCSATRSQDNMLLRERSGLRVSWRFLFCSQLRPLHA